MDTKKLLKKISIFNLLPKTSKRGSSPGTVSYIGETRLDPVNIQIITYDADSIIEKESQKFDEIMLIYDPAKINWININGVYDTELIKEVGNRFSIHPLVLSDIANTTQRAKVEEYEGYLYIIVKTINFHEETHSLVIEQISLIVGNNFLITFQELHKDIFDPLKVRIRHAQGKVRKQGNDYLTYTVIDAVIDNYYHALEQSGGQIEELEERLSKDTSPETLNSIYKLKRELLYLRKSIWPMREVVNNLQRSEYEIIKPETAIFFRDVYDHTIQVVETIETFRDISVSMLDLYLSTVSNKMNEVMKVLTIFSAIFIPLTFLVGVYGMNFEYLPELTWKYGYFMLWGIMITATITMIIYFKRRKWI